MLHNVVASWDQALKELQALREWSAALERRMSARADADFVESEHPRDAEGKFAASREGADKAFFHYRDIAGIHETMENKAVVEHYNKVFMGFLEARRAYEGKRKNADTLFASASKLAEKHMDFVQQKPLQGSDAFRAAQLLRAQPTSGEKSALSRYAGGMTGHDFYKRANAALRTGDLSDKSVNTSVRALSKYLARTKLGADMITHRSIDPETAKRIGESGVFHEKGFLSTTMSENYAHLWGGDTNVVMEVHLSKDAHAAPIKEPGTLDREFEIVVQKDADLIVREWDPKTKRLVVEVKT